MAICKCKMCGGDLHIEETDKVVECEYCGTTQTVPSADSEKKMTLFNRANRLRLANEFDKAAGIYENIIAEFPEEAEAYWGAVLCKYGIEYVDDPATGKKIPTCHRSSFDSVMEDENFEQACENADVTARRVYREEAKRLEEIRKGIIEVSAEEAPYDIFICYKETDENGDRTVDSAIAQDVYTALTEKGYRVFFSRISLEDKLGQEYEPYIFAALNSAKVMLVFGTDYEYFNAVWVKNEWSRFLKLIAAGQKKTLIPCYKDIDAYDMPKEFAKLQSQDMGKVGAIQDLLRGVDKIFGKGAAQPAQAAPVQVPVAANPVSATADTLLKRAFMFLEDGDWAKADEYAEKVLDIEPENGEAYLAKGMAELRVRHRNNLKACPLVDSNETIKKVLRYGNEELRAEVNGYISTYLEAKRIKEEAERREKEEKQEAERKAREAEQRAREAAFAVFAEKRRQIAPVQCVVAANDYHTVGLKKDGTVVAVGSKDYGRCKVSDWNDIVAVSAGEEHTVGLKRDGTVVASGSKLPGQCNTEDWKGIVSVCAGSYHTVGLKKDGTVVATGHNQFDQCNVSNWEEIVAVSAGDAYTVGLKMDGSVVSVGSNKHGQRKLSNWNNIVAISTGNAHTLGLKIDGTVVAAGSTGNERCAVSHWNDIVAVVAGGAHSVGLKKDGTVVAVGYNDFGQSSVSDWKLFDDYRTYEQERVQAMRERVFAMKKEKAKLEAELPTLTGIFKAIRRKEVEARLAEIETELKKLGE